MKEREIEELEQKHKEWLIKGLKENKVFAFPDVLFDYLRPYSFGGLPVSILLLITEMNNGHCYDRAMLMQLAFDKCRMVYADIESLRIRYGEESAEHAYIETDEFGGGKTWVVDTSTGLIYEKEYFDEFEKPKVNRVFTKEECMQSKYIQDILASDFEKDKWSLVLTLPMIESAIKHSNNMGTIVYKEKLLEEIAKLKEVINFDAMQKKVKEDMQLMRTNPSALDKKFKIVRDKYGREISREGVKNPYYQKTNKKDLKSILDDKKELELNSLVYEKMLKRNIKIHIKENLKTQKRASKQLKIIAQNPTQNVYEQKGKEK